MKSVMPKTKLLKEFVQLAIAGNINAYSEEGAARKQAFHSKGRAVLRQIAQTLGLQSGTYDIRSNLGGMAVSGEVTLHGEHIYIQFSESCIKGAYDFYFRSCNGRKDYTGGPNNWMKWETLLDLNQACFLFRQVMKG